MLMISREAIESIIAIKEKLADPGKKSECIADIEKTIEILEKVGISDAQNRMSAYPHQFSGG